MRWSRILVAALFLLAVAACSSPAASGPDDNPDDGGSSDQPAASQAAASQDDGNSDGDGDGDGDGSAGSLDDVYNALIPPNSTEQSKTTAGGAVFGTYISTDSVDSLVDFYESAIPGTGMEIFSTTNAQEGTNWLFGEGDGSEIGGSVSVAPNTNGDGTAVIVTITESE
jgi:hypothetical protein